MDYLKVNWSIFYIFQDPFGKNDCKIGITSNPKIRLDTYQASYSRRSHTACFDMLYIGSKDTVAYLEKIVKQFFDWDIEQDGGGVTEWISNYHFYEIEQKIDDLIKGWRFKIIKADKMFTPLNIDNLNDFIEYYRHVGIS